MCSQIHNVSFSFIIFIARITYIFSLSSILRSLNDANLLDLVSNKSTKAKEHNHNESKITSITQNDVMQSEVYVLSSTQVEVLIANMRLNHICFAQSSSSTSPSNSSQAISMLPINKINFTFYQFLAIISEVASLFKVPHSYSSSIDYVMIHFFRLLQCPHKVPSFPYPLISTITESKNMIDRALHNEKLFSEYNDVYILRSLIEIENEGKYRVFPQIQNIWDHNIDQVCLFVHMVISSFLEMKSIYICLLNSVCYFQYFRSNNYFRIMSS